MVLYEGIISNSLQSFLEVASGDDDVAIGNGIGHHTQEYFQENSHAVQFKPDSVSGEHFPLRILRDVPIYAPERIYSVR